MFSYITELFIYLLFASIMSYLAWVSRRAQEAGLYKIDEMDPYLWGYIFFFTFIGGFRWSVGGDSITYAKHFAFGTPEVRSGEWIWYYLTNGIHNLGLPWETGQIVCSFLQIFFIVYALKEYRYLLVFIPFVLFGGRYWGDLCGATRQMMVACAFIWTSKFITDRKMVKFLLFIFVAQFLHHSALFLLPFYFIPLNGDWYKKQWLLTSILLICVLLGQIEYFSSYIGSWTKIAEFADYEQHASNMDRMLSQDSERLSFGITMMSFLLIPLFIIWYGPHLKRISLHNKYFNLWYNLSFIYAATYFVLCNLGHLFIRPVLYLSLFQMIMAALVLYYLIGRYKLLSTNLLTAIVFCFIISISTAWSIHLANGIQWESVTYKWVFSDHPEMKLAGL